MRPLLASLLLATCYLLLATISPAFAQSQTPTNTSTTAVVQPNPYLNPNTNPDVPQNAGTWTQVVMINLMSAMMCQLSGINPTDQNQRCLGVDSETGKIGFVDPSTSSGGGGAVGVVGGLIAATFTRPPVSTATYLSYMGEKFGIVSPAYAQGTGFVGISPLVRIWEGFRNIAYLAFVVVFVIIGFMIMLRVKIDPRTVMTIQNSIPRVIIGMLLVTFSFAIAGFLIDLMYVLTYLTINLLDSFAGTSIDAAQATSDLQGRNVFQFANSNASVGTGGIFSVIGAASGAISSIVASFFTGELTPPANPLDLLGWLGSLVNLITGALGNLLGGIAGVLASLVITIAILWALFRLWFALILAFVWILIDVVLAPIWILAGIVPGGPVNFTSWLRDIAGNLSAFPATVFMLLLGRIFIDTFVAQGATGTVFVPPLIGAPNADALGAFIALGVILLTPQVVTMVKDAIKAPKFPYGSAVGAALGVGAAGAAVPLQTGRKLAALRIAHKRADWEGVAQYLTTGQMPFPNEGRPREPDI